MWVWLHKNKHFSYAFSSIMLILIVSMFPSIFPYGKDFSDIALSSSYSLAFFIIYSILVLILASFSLLLYNLYKSAKNKGILFWEIFTVYFITGLYIVVAKSLIYYFSTKYTSSLISYLNSIQNYVYIGLFIYLSYTGLKRLTKASSSVIGMNTATILIMFYIALTGTLDVFSVYLFVFLLLYLNREKFKPEGIMLMKRFKWGISLMNRFSKYRKTLKFFEFFSIIIAYLGMIGISIYLLYNLYEVYFMKAIPGISPVLPGVKIPGSPIVLPLWYGLISIFLAALIHEFSHGIYARLYKLRIKFTGFAMLGPFLGAAFVDIDEKQLEKSLPLKQISVLSAGPFSNILTALILILIATFILNPFTHSLIAVHGISINIIPNTPADLAGLKSDMVITNINGVNITNSSEFMRFLNTTKPNQSVSVMVSYNPDPYVQPSNWSYQKFVVKLGSRPDNSTRAYFGIHLSNFAYFKQSAIEKYGKYFIEFILILSAFLFWFYVISLGIGVANLLPIGPVDGGRILLVTLRLFMKDENAKYWWERISIFFLIIIILILFSPIFV